MAVVFHTLLGELGALEDLALFMSRRDASEWGPIASHLLEACEVGGMMSRVLAYYTVREIECCSDPRQLFRATSFRSTVLAAFLRSVLLPWFKQSISGMTRRVLTGQFREGAAEPVALEMLKACAGNTKSIPSSARDLLQFLAQRERDKFPAEIDAQQAVAFAAVFAFLHVLTPAVVSPTRYGLLAEDATSEVQAMFLAVGKLLQSWSNNVARAGVKPGPGEKLMVKLLEALFSEKRGETGKTRRSSLFGSKGDRKSSDGNLTAGALRASAEAAAKPNGSAETLLKRASSSVGSSPQALSPVQSPRGGAKALDTLFADNVDFFLKQRDYSSVPSLAVPGSYGEIISTLVLTTDHN